MGGVEFAKTELEGLNPAIMSIGQTLSSSLSQGFMEGIQTGKNLFQSLTQSILAGMAQLLAQQAAAAGVAGLLSLIPGVGTFGTIYKGLGGLFGGESASASPMTGVDVTQGRGGVSQGLQEVKRAIRDIDIKFDPVGLHVVSEQGRVAFGAR